jgi:O-acetyl-ADP-ribose deacetylase (regulator of RNase III)
MCLSLHVLQTPVVLLPGYSCIISIIYITVPVTTVAITPAGENNVVYIIEGETQTFACTTASSRPATWIQLYNYYYLYYSTSDNSDNHSSW